MVSKLIFALVLCPLAPLFGSAPATATTQTNAGYAAAIAASAASAAAPAQETPLEQAKKMVATAAEKGRRQNNAKELYNLLIQLPMQEQVTIVREVLSATKPQDWWGWDYFKIPLSVMRAVYPKEIAEFNVPTNPWGYYLSNTIERIVPDKLFIADPYMYEYIKEFALDPAHLIEEGYARVESPKLKFAHEAVLPGSNWLSSHTPAQIDQYFKDVHHYYKFHLMPTADEMIPTLKILLDDLSNPKSKLGPYITGFKFIASKRMINSKRQEPYLYANVVIYAARGKDNAQHGLNELYALFENSGIKGMGRYPRFSAMVTPLIFITQGDSEPKRMRDYQRYFEPGFDSPPLGRVYLKNAEEKGYLLWHPNTGNWITYVPQYSVKK